MPEANLTKHVKRVVYVKLSEGKCNSKINPTFSFSGLFDLSVFSEFKIWIDLARDDFTAMNHWCKVLQTCKIIIKVY